MNREFATLKIIGLILYLFFASSIEIFAQCQNYPIDMSYWRRFSDRTGDIYRVDSGLWIEGGVWTRGCAIRGKRDGNGIESTRTFDFSHGGEIFMVFALTGRRRFMLVNPSLFTGLTVRNISTVNSKRGSIVVPENEWLYAHLTIYPNGTYNYTLCFEDYDADCIMRYEGRARSLKGKLFLSFSDNHAGQSAGLILYSAYVCTEDSAPLGSYNSSRPRSYEECLNEYCPECKNVIILGGIAADKRCQRCLDRNRNKIKQCEQGSSQQSYSEPDLDYSDLRYSNEVERLRSIIFYEPDPQVLEDAWRRFVQLTELPVGYCHSYDESRYYNVGCCYIMVWPLRLNWQNQLMNSYSIVCDNDGSYTGPIKGGPYEGNGRFVVWGSARFDLVVNILQHAGIPDWLDVPN